MTTKILVRQSHDAHGCDTTIKIYNKDNEYVYNFVKKDILSKEQLKPLLEQHVNTNIVDVDMLAYNVHVLMYLPTIVDTLIINNIGSLGVHICENIKHLIIKDTIMYAPLRWIDSFRNLEILEFPSINNMYVKKINVLSMINLLINKCHNLTTIRSPMFNSVTSSDQQNSKWIINTFKKAGFDVEINDYGLNIISDNNMLVKSAAKK